MLRLRRGSALLATIACLTVIALAGCGSSGATSSSAGGAAGATSGHVHFAKTKFLFHAGLAFGAFHHFIYKPVRAGILRHPFLHKLALVKAGLAALFVYHELKLAAVDVRSSRILSKLFSPLTAAADKLRALKSSLTNGSANPASLSSVNSQLGQIGRTSSGAGQPIQDAVPGAAALAAG